MKILFTHPIGNANVRAILNGLNDEGYLDSFYTSLATYPNNIWDFLSRFKGLSEFNRRNYNPTLQKFTYTFPYKELGRMFALKTGLSGFTKHETGIFSVDEVFKYASYKASLDLHNKTNLTAVYAYEDGALELFIEAKKNGLSCIYDLPIAYWETGRKLMLEESERLPSWAVTLAGGIKDSKKKLERKTKELELADFVIVPSLFVKDSLPENKKASPTILAPFGSPSIFSSLNTTKKQNKLRVLFAGSMGQRKGLGDLFQAVKLLNNSNIELVIMGSPIASMEFYRKQYQNFTYEPPRPHSEVLALMRTCDIFCLPSIVEGRALVMQEAMSQGLPLIITPNSGGEDLIIEGETGFLVPIRKPDLIAEKLLWFLNNKNHLEYMSECSKKQAAKYTWKKYTQTVITGIESLLVK